MQPGSGNFQGRFETVTIASEVLRGNPLGDPTERPLLVYLPPAAAQRPAGRYPTIYMLQGLMNQVDMWWNRSAFRPSVPELVDQLFARGEAPPAIVAFVDAWTALGGSQFLNSPATGRYLDYLCDEVVPFVDGRYPTLADAAHRGIAGHSSGGYGAMVVPMLRSGVFGALASHSGDALFEFSYMPDLATAARALCYEYDGSYDAFWADFRSRPAFTRRSDAALLNAYAMAACYSAEADGTVSLPFDPATGVFRDEIWRRWQALDPVRLAPRRADALRALAGIYLDAGRQDEYFLDLGAVAFSAELSRLRVDHHFELFNGPHSRIEYRYPLALRFLAERLTPS